MAGFLEARSKLSKIMTSAPESRGKEEIRSTKRVVRFHSCSLAPHFIWVCWSCRCHQLDAHKYIGVAPVHDKAAIIAHAFAEGMGWRAHREETLSNTSRRGYKASKSVITECRRRRRTLSSIKILSGSRLPMPFKTSLECVVNVAANGYIHHQTL
jgi:hypothetical protein